ncbi:hypothetical protein B9Z55_018068 [Caenorhabditis nigoni]|uniref:Uncharacterized protein n=1 Tax=Caenorhabditis nigoni TaxID=1611254 RepID=A0A2G5TCG0_9PELO|nr:hypothetical protein B9Z55_018068 [Caenorhabditis nigoni]
MDLNSTKTYDRFDRKAGNLSRQIFTLVQLIYGFPSVCLMGYIFIHLATSSKYKNSFYRLVQGDLLFILGHVPNGATVTFYVENIGGKNYGTGTVPTDFFAPWSAPVVGDDIVINSTNAQMGQYFVQYFVIRELFKDNCS